MEKVRACLLRLPLLWCLCLLLVSSTILLNTSIESKAATVPSDFTGVNLDDDGVYRYYENGVVTGGKGLILWDNHYYYVRTAGNVATNMTYNVAGNSLNHLLRPGSSEWFFDETGKLTDCIGTDRNGIKYDCFCGEAHYYINGHYDTYYGLLLYKGDYYYVRTAHILVLNQEYSISESNGLLPVGRYTFDEFGRMVDPPSDEPTYDDGYEDGYNAGFEAGEGSVDTDSFYQQGYEAGLELGESSGYESGYNAGFEEGKDSVDTDSYYQQGFEAGKESVDTEAIYQEAYEAGQNSIDTDSIYQEAFEAGKNSVDTDAYYDEGYQKGFEAGVTEAFAQGYQEGLDEGYTKGYDEGYDEGYAIGFSDGYEEGYDKGYNDAMDVIKSFGADTTEYPLHIKTVNGSNTHTSAYPMYDFATDIEYIPYEFDLTSSDFSPKYVYCISGFLENFCFGGQFFEYDDAEIILMVGGSEYFIGSMSGGFTNKFSPGFKVFVPGSNMSTKIGIKVVAYGAYGSVPKEEYSYPYMNLITDSCVMYVQNYGPINGTQQNAIANQTEILESTLEEQKEIQKEQTETQKGIASSIKEFFGSFFDNLVNSIIGIFVPSTEEMGNLFNRLNDFFAETFGFLYYPFDFIIEAFNIFLEADSETGLTLPGFSIMGYEVWDSQTYDIASEPIVGTIFGYVRMGTGAMLAMWFVNYLRNFFDKRFGGGGN